MPATVTRLRRFSATEAGLRDVYDAQPGFQSKKAGEGSRNVEADGKPIRSKRFFNEFIPRRSACLDRCLDLRRHRGHLQATGRDVRGRKQSRYHPCWQRGIGPRKQIVGPYHHANEAAVAIVPNSRLKAKQAANSKVVQMVITQQHTPAVQEQVAV